MCISCGTSRDVGSWRVSGKVQGVGYRAWVCKQAQGLGLIGWVRNTADGAVEVVAVGEKLQLFAARLCQGPKDALVERVEPKHIDFEMDFSSFEIRK